MLNKNSPKTAKRHLPQHPTSKQRNSIKKDKPNVLWNGEQNLCQCYVQYCLGHKKKNSQNHQGPAFMWCYEPPVCGPCTQQRNQSSNQIKLPHLNMNCERRIASPKQPPAKPHNWLLAPSFPWHQMLPPLQCSFPYPRISLSTVFENPVCPCWFLRGYLPSLSRSKKLQGLCSPDNPKNEMHVRNVVWLVPCRTRILRHVYVVMRPTAISRRNALTLTEMPLRQAGAWMGFCVAIKPTNIPDSRWAIPYLLHPSHQTTSYVGSNE